jgi:predicted Zn-dependent peptidase
MNYVKFATALVALGLGLGVARAGDESKKRPDQVPVPPLKSWNVPEAKKTTLKNGVTLFVLEDHDLPLVEIRCTLRAGGLWDPDDKVGLAGLAGEVWRTGGTKTHPAEQLDQLLEKRGAVLEIHVGHDSGSIHLSVLKEDADFGLGLVKELLTEPTFDAAKLDQAKRARLAGIKRRNDTAPPIAERVFDMTIFGKTSPSAREIDKKSIAKITRDDLVEWHKKFVRPQNFIVGAFGDLSADDLTKKVEAAFGGLTGGDEKPQMPLVDVARKASVVVVNKDVDQSAIIVGHVGGVRSPKNVDEYAQLVCMNEILGGGGFTSRLMLVVRTDMGLAYDVHSQLGIDYDHPGTFQLVCQTKTESTIKAIKAMLAEAEKIRATPCTDEELAVAKESILNQVPFWVDTTEKVVDRSLNYEYRGFPQDTLKRFTDALAKVTKEDVLKVAKAYIHPETYTTVVCGDAAHFDAPIESIANGAPVEKIEDPEAWAHPGGSDEKTSKTDGAGDAKAGAALLAKVVESAGGKAALDALAGIHMKQKITVKQEGQEQKLEIDVVTQYPDKLRLVMTVPGLGKLTQVLNGTQGWASVPGRGQGPLKGPEVAALRQQLDGSLLSLLKAAASGEVTAVVEGEEKFHGTQASRLTLKRGKVSATYFVDASGKLLGKVEENRQLGEKVRMTFGDEKPVGGVNFPMSQIGRLESAGEDSEPVLTITFDAADANPKVDDKTFAAPAADEKKPDEGKKPKKGGDDDDDD